MIFPFLLRSTKLVLGSNRHKDAAADCMLFNWLVANYKRWLWEIVMPFLGDCNARYVELSLKKNLELWSYRMEKYTNKHLVQAVADAGHPKLKHL